MERFCAMPTHSTWRLEREGERENEREEERERKSLGEGGEREGAQRGREKGGERGLLSPFSFGHSVTRAGGEEKRGKER